MDPRLELTTLPLDSCDDDPRWAGWQDQIALSFQQGKANDLERRLFREHARAEDWRLRGVIAEDSTPNAMPVATFTSVDKQLNVGPGRTVPANLISDVTVRATHRRRGLLRALMTADLREAKERGCVLAALTASEGGIYGRFGFGVSSRLAEATIDARKFKLRRESAGSISYVDPAALGEHYERLIAAALDTEFGYFARWPFHRAMVLGEFSWDSKGPNTKLYALLHRDAAGQVDGLAVYEPVEDSDPGAIKVVEVIGRTPAATLALWEFLAALDLVDELRTKRLRLDDPLQWALTDPRVVRITRVYDMLWIRVLDTERALRERRYDTDGELVLRVTDPMGLADGTFALSVRAGRASVEAAAVAPDATVDAETLGQLYLAGVAPAALAAAGRIEGDADAVVRLFSVLTAPYDPVGF